MPPNCSHVQKAYSGMCATSAVIWLAWLVWWTLQQRRPVQHFSWVVTALLTLKIAENAVAAAHFADENPTQSLTVTYYVLDALKEAGSMSYLFPVVRGTLRFNRRVGLELLLTFCVLFAAMLAFRFLKEDATVAGGLWGHNLTELFVNTLLLHFASETIDKGEEMLKQLANHRYFELAQLLKRLRWVVIVLLLSFMKQVFDILALFDLETFRQCSEIPVDFPNVAVDWALNSCVMLLLQPRKGHDEILLLENS